MLTPKYQKRFKKDVEKLKKQGKDMRKLKIMIKMVLNNKQLPAKYLNHKLKGEYSDCMECHIEPDWLLIYMKVKQGVVFIRTGSHAELF
ncbi:MAG: type II toxin-antitoxin system YafQ family toxin [Legionellales bacterium]|nr:type II toxin-antitoxin system YafQ family toxin [Legionellales bacterium]